MAVSEIVMPAPLPTAGAPEKLAVRAMFDRIAPRYDLLNRVLSAGTDVRWRRACVNQLELPPGSRVLDLCTGTADLLIEALGRDPSHRGVGLDLSVPMLARGVAKLARRVGNQRGVVLAGDAERLPLASSRFDGAMVAFGIRNLGDPSAALGEIHRVLRPGGRLVVLEFSMPPGLIGRAYRLYFGHLLPRLGGLLSGDRGAYSYLPESVRKFPDPAAFRLLMSQAGFGNLGSKPLTAGIAHLHRGERRP